MKLKIFSVLAGALALTTSCSGNKAASEQIDEEPEAKTVIIYYSQTGATKSVAEDIQKLLNVPIDSIVPQESYGTDYDATIERWKKEREDSVEVAIKPLNIDLADYDTIFLGFPIWGGTFASPVETFLKENSLAGKTIVTFATFGSGGIEPATKDVAQLQPEAKVEEGFGIRNARIAKASAEVKRFLIEKGFIEGEVNPLPEYGAEENVNEEEIKIFDEACGNYQFPLGTPVKVAKRSYDGVTDYKFEVKSTGPDGKEHESTIYVTCEPNSTPEFTRVVRH